MKVEAKTVIDNKEVPRWVTALSSLVCEMLSWVRQSHLSSIEKINESSSAKSTSAHPPDCSSHKEPPPQELLMHTSNDWECKIAQFSLILIKCHQIAQCASVCLEILRSTTTLGHWNSETVFHCYCFDRLLF